MTSSRYIRNETRSYALYTLEQRAIPALSDGLKTSGRRALWTARDGKKRKTATLAGEMMPLHPHAQADGAIGSLTGPYINNIPLFHGTGAFGTLLKNNAIGASRYTSVQVSEFTKDVIFRDIELIPMVPNYDDTLEEPKHFIPLVPEVLVNSSEGIAVGFASSILPRRLDHIIEDQIKHLKKKRISDRCPSFIPLDLEGTKTENGRYEFQGKFETLSKNKIKVTRLPYGLDHEKFIEFLIRLEEEGTIKDFIDRSKDYYDIEITFKYADSKRLEDKSHTLKRLKLITTKTQNNNMLDFDGQRVINLSYTDIVKTFTDWRVTWYEKRYRRLADLLSADIQKYNDILLAIEAKVGTIASEISSRNELKEVLTELGIVNIDYIADLSVYRFTEEERKKVENKLAEANKLMEKYERLLSSEKLRTELYITELQEILKKYKKGYYN